MVHLLHARARMSLRDRLRWRGEGRRTERPVPKVLRLMRLSDVRSTVASALLSEMSIVTSAGERILCVAHSRQRAAACARAGAHFEEAADEFERGEQQCGELRVMLHLPHARPRNARHHARVLARGRARGRTHHKLAADGRE